MGRIEIGSALVGDERPREVIALVQCLPQVVVRPSMVGKSFCCRA